MYGPHRRFSAGILRRIPQAVSAVATWIWTRHLKIFFYLFVSILQAVSTFTLSISFSPLFGQGLEMCGSHRRISQVISTVATTKLTGYLEKNKGLFQYRKR